MYYSVEDGSTRSRTVQPLHLFLLDEKWYLFCRYPGEPKTIRRLLLTRMSQVRGTGRKFRRPAKFDPDKLLENSVGIYGAGVPVPVRLRIEPRTARYLEERPFHKSQRIVFDPEGKTAELTVTIGITPDLEGIILRWGSRIEVLEPLSLRESVLRHAREIVARG
jgi:predicted DNA-binding transcriptional regulator YafY